MESLCVLHNHPNPIHLSFSRVAFFKSHSPYPPTLKPFPPKTLISLRAFHKTPKPFSPKTLISFRASHKTPKPPSSSSKNHTPKTLETFYSLLKPTCIALTTFAALFFARLHNPSLAAVSVSPPPPAAVQSESKDPETLTEEEKERTLEEYLDSHPDDVKSLRALMELKIKSHKLPEAISTVDRLILLEPDDKDLPLLKAHLQIYNGDTEEAKLGFEEIISRNPYSVEAYHGLVMTVYQWESDGGLDNVLKRIEVAMEMCKREKRKADLRDFKLLLAQIRVIEGKYEESLKMYQELVKEEPRDFRPYLCQGIIYTLLKKKDEAEKQFQKYRRLVPKGHPYAQYFDDNMIAMKVFSQMDENRRKSSPKS